MSTHFARPMPVPGTVRTPSRGEHPCRVCGQPVVRKGKFMSSDGVKGQWTHKVPGKGS